MTSRNPNRRIFLTTSTALVGAALALAPIKAMASDPKSGGTLRYAVNETIDTFDPFMTNSTIVRTMHSHVFESLYTYDSRYGLIPELAVGHEVSEDGKEWTFTLVEGAQFHDGSALDAQDVVATWDRFLNISPRAPQISADVERVHAPDATTVIFEFSADPGPFLEKLSAPHTAFKILPLAIAEAATGRPLEDGEFIGTGPFLVKEWRRGDALILGRAENYRTDDRYEGPDGLGGRRTAFLDEVIWAFVSEPGAQEAGLRSGRFNFADSVPVELRVNIEGTSGFAGTILKPLNWLNIMVNHDNPPLDDIRIRRAIQIGIDRELVMLGAIGDPDLLRLSPGLAFDEQVWSNSAGADYYSGNDKDEARRLIAEADYAGQEIVLMTTRTLDKLYKSAVIVQQELQSIGLNVRLEVLDWGALLAHVTGGELRPKWHLSSMEHSVRHDPFGWDTNFRSNVWTPYVNPEMDALLDKIATLRDFDTRYEAFEGVQNLFYEDVVNIKIGDYFGWHAHASNVKGYKSFNGSVFWDVWIED
jgi:peptide/nickel transport system substrate-binding protein